MNRLTLIFGFAAVALSGWKPADAAARLPQLKIDVSQTTVSGLSSGGFMANQLGYAYSSTFRGVAVFAAGPYMCAGHSNYTACMYNASIGSAMLNTMQADINNWSGTAIDEKENVARQRIYMFVGTGDTTVGPESDERRAGAIRRKRRCSGKHRIREARWDRAHLSDRFQQHWKQCLQHQRIALHQQLRL
jgi:poly(3-hydroxybutyrate) depolymerase